MQTRCLSITLNAGRLEAVLDLRHDDPLAGDLAVYGDGIRLADASIRAHEMGLVATAEIPASFLSDGIHHLILASGDGTTVHASTTLVAGKCDSDIRAEIDLLRGELELVKQALRRLARR